MIERGPLYVVAEVCSVKDGVRRFYHVTCSGYSIATLRGTCTCPEARYGAERGYRLAVACKHVLLLHAIKTRKTCAQVEALMRLLYGDESWDQGMEVQGDE